MKLGFFSFSSQSYVSHLETKATDTLFNV